MVYDDVNLFIITNHSNAYMIASFVKNAHLRRLSCTLFEQKSPPKWGAFYIFLKAELFGRIFFRIGIFGCLSFIRGRPDFRRIQLALC